MRRCCPATVPGSSTQPSMIARQLGRAIDSGEDPEATSDGEYADEISLRVDSAVLEVDALMKEQRGDVLAA